MLIESPAGLYCPAGGFHVDPWGPCERALITHAHGDHARPGSRAYLCADPSRPLLARRFGPEPTIESLPYGETVTLGDVRVSFHPAGHILGSAQIRIEGSEGVWVLSGDYKRAADPSSASFRAAALRHVRHRVDLRAPHLSLGSGSGHRRRDPGVVGRESQSPAHIDPVLLHDRQGAAPAGRAGRRHGPSGLRTRRHGADDRGVP